MHLWVPDKSSAASFLHEYEYLEPILCIKNVGLILKKFNRLHPLLKPPKDFFSSFLPACGVYMVFYFYLSIFLPVESRIQRDRQADKDNQWRLFKPQVSESLSEERTVRRLLHTVVYTSLGTPGQMTHFIAF